MDSLDDNSCWDLIDYTTLIDDVASTDFDWINQSAIPEFDYSLTSGAMSLGKECAEKECSRKSKQCGTLVPILNQVIAPSSSPINQDQGQYTDNFIVRDEDYVVIELGEEINGDGPLLRAQERLNSGEQQVKASPSSSQKKFEQKLVKKRAKKFGHGHVSSMGDECIDIRGKDERLSVQPIRRSFSMDSAMDRQLYLAVQEIVQQNRNGNGNGNGIGSDIVSSSEGCSNRIRRSFFSFGNGRGSRRAVLPVHLEQ